MIFQTTCSCYFILICDLTNLHFFQLHRGSSSRKSLGGNLIAEKLDSLMVLTFEHLESCEAGGRLVEVLLTVIFLCFSLCWPHMY